MGLAAGAGLGTGWVASYSEHSEYDPVRQAPSSVLTEPPDFLCTYHATALLGGKPERTVYESHRSLFRRTECSNAAYDFFSLSVQFIIIASVYVGHDEIPIAISDCKQFDCLKYVRASDSHFVLNRVLWQRQGRYRDDGSGNFVTSGFNSGWLLDYGDGVQIIQNADSAYFCFYVFFWSGEHRIMTSTPNDFNAGRTPVPDPTFSFQDDGATPLKVRQIPVPGFLQAYASVGILVELLG